MDATGVTVAAGVTDAAGVLMLLVRCMLRV
jgi:hypothetical protein